MATQQDTYDYTLRLADNCLILGQRLAEWCGHGPVLEQDIALTNISLDLIGQARNYYQYAAELTGSKKSEDDIAFLRNDREYKNLLLVEQPNIDFGYTIIRQYFFDVFHFHLLNELATSQDKTLAGIAQKSQKEVTYHKRWSGQWVFRLGDGTDESHERTQAALDHFWPYAFESVIPDTLDKNMTQYGIGADLSKIEEIVKKEITNHLREATLTLPTETWNQTGGKNGLHSEHLGYLLAEMQHLQRAYPGAEW
ncbi:phenylacetate-CoA oxygenase subunit PaaC [Reichenbachiella carrageenanivorans]|uniref:Phenylacetate-CoA oxygenase subunit PaaC n=1 Tax=Reichenbachiella carrageenanivorans TaxID=2979869 RepID=A0ABY6CZK1_9BACT|nr:1,2-phenylacetyl-CoA epoxidase subunit PaaC [Reichenbachiella carrageenanivorans]UXX78859.1 phenylacetate-CoA oxygenase subunit PaaC [Reichenbachiella carrageenanivorans]